jgi:hypothetical protein
MAVSVYLLNKLFYYQLDMGTNGLALATLIVVFTANTFKLYFVKRRFSIAPFTNKSLLLILIITVFYLGFNFWDFPIDTIYLDIYTWKIPIHPIIKIILKSILITIIYIFLIFKLNISPELDAILKKYYK